MAVETEQPPEGNTRLRQLVENESFSNIIIAAIVVNVIVLILGTSEAITAEFGSILHAVHKLSLIVFIAEMILKIVAYQWSFFRSAWNIFDLVIVVVAMVPAAGNMSILRAIRLARALRIVSAFRQISSEEAAEADTFDTSTRRGRVRALMERGDTRNFILGVIVLNGILLGISTSADLPEESRWILSFFDRIIIVIFVIEMVLKLYAYRMRFFASAWNIFDLVIVVISLMPQSDTLSVLRGMRVIRALRVMSAIPQMREVVKALLDALPGMGAVVLLLGVMFYIFGIMATLWFGDAFPQWFGTLGASLYSLFQIMTLESWSMGIVRPVMEQFPWAWAFFVPFIIMTAFAVLNLFI
ncbi:MAG: ion transporter, partial [Pseudomonadota bacterium]